MHASQRILITWFWGASLISLLFVLILPVRWYFPEFFPGVLNRMMITNENNLAAWWSGVLLFMLAVHAYDAYVLMRERAFAGARAWAILVALFIFLSADEIGSMHERLGRAGKHLGIGMWGLLLPLAVLIGISLLHALRTLWRSEGLAKRKVAQMFVGFALLGSVAVQEFLEHAIEWGPGAAIWIRAAVEEGTELLGMIVLLNAVLPPSLAVAGRPIPSERRLFAILLDRGRATLIAAFILIPIFTILGVLFQDGSGRLADWLAAAAFLAAGLTALNRIITGETAKKRRLVGVAALCLIASAALMWYDPGRIVRIGDFEAGKRILVLAPICLLVCGLSVTSTNHLSRKIVLFVGAVGLLTMFAPVVGSGMTYSILITQVFAILVAAVVCVVLRPHRRAVSNVAARS